MGFGRCGGRGRHTSARHDVPQPAVTLERRSSLDEEGAVLNPLQIRVRFVGRRPDADRAATQNRTAALLRRQDERGDRRGSERLPLPCEEGVPGDKGQVRRGLISGISRMGCGRQPIFFMKSSMFPAIAMRSRSSSGSIWVYSGLILVCPILRSLSFSGIRPRVYV